MTDDEAKREAQEIDDATKKHMASYDGTFRQRVLECARYLVAKNIVETSGANDGVPRHLFMSGDALPWCAGFVSYCLRQAAYPLGGTIYDQHVCSKLVGLVGDAVDQPSCGDLIFYFGRQGSDALLSNDVHHCGIVEDVDADTVSTIEGNFGNKLTRRSVKRNLKSIACYRRPGV